MTDTPIDPTALNTDVNAYKHAQRKPKGPLKLTWRHKAFAREYVSAGMPEDATSIVMRVGLANDPHSAARSARNYLQRQEMQALIAKALQDSGITEGGIREVVKRWMWHEDGNLALRAAELAAKLLGLLREPAPSVPQLPPLIVMQAPQQVSSPDAVQAEYTVETPSTTRQLPINETPAEPCQNDVDNPSVSDTARASLISIPRHAPAREGHNELRPLINVSEKASETPPKALKAPKPVKSRTPKAKSAKAKRPTKADR